MISPTNIQCDQPVCSPLPDSDRAPHWFDWIWKREIWQLREVMHLSFECPTGQFLNGVAQTIKFEFDIPVGFVSDFASVPRPLQWPLRESSIKSAAAYAHDYLYWLGWPKEMCDAIFFVLLKANRAPRFDQFIMFRAVLDFGGNAYEAHRRANHPNAPLDQAQLA